MSPNNNESLQLPPPVVEQAPSGDKQGEVAPQSPERAAAPERASQAGAAAPAGTASVSLPTLPIAPVSNQGQDLTSVNQGNPAQASDDADIIEKEWVNKAKQIVERTRSDPHKQSEELTVFKADYMKKRYNRTIKVSN